MSQRMRIDFLTHKEIQSIINLRIRLNKMAPNYASTFVKAGSYTEDIHKLGKAVFWGPDTVDIGDFTRTEQLINVTN